MKSRFTIIVFAVAALIMSSATAYSHCEIPCGIYDDAMRIKMISEHITTIEKSMGKIMDIEKSKHHDANQLVRWVVNKEEHANQLQEIVTQYFMTQRLKTDQKNYTEKLSLLHQMLVAAMKSKQTTDTKYPDQLRELLKKFEQLYFAPH